MLRFTGCHTVAVLALILTAFGAGSAFAGPLLYYSYDSPDDATDNVITDNSGNGRDAFVTVHDAATALVDVDVPAALSASSDQSLALTEDADGDGVQMGRVITPGELNFNTQSWTAATWYQRSTSTGNDMIIHIGNGDGFGGDNELYVYQPGGSSTLRLEHYNPQDISINAGTYATGAWHHVAVVHDADADVVRFYVDGVLAGSDTSFNLNMDQTKPLHFGGQNATSGVGFKNRGLDGKLDDSAVWSSALSAFAIESLVNGNLDPNAVPTQRSTGLFLYYSFESPDVHTDSQATDNSGNGRTATLSQFGTGTATYVNDSPAGILGSKSLQLTGVDNTNAAQLSRAISTSELNFSSENWTFASWYKTSDTGVNMLMHIGDGDGFGSENELYLNAHGGQIDFQHYKGDGLQDINLFKSGLDTAQWHHAVVTYDAGTNTFMFYIDGELIGSDSDAVLAMNQGTAFRIGVANATHSRDFTGLVDEVGLWTRTLNLAQVRDLYTGAQLTFSVVPEPATVVMLPLAAAAILMRRRRAG